MSQEFGEQNLHFSLEYIENIFKSPFTVVLHWEGTIEVGSCAEHEWHEQFSILPYTEWVWAAN